MSLQRFIPLHTHCIIQHVSCVFHIQHHLQSKQGDKSSKSNRGQQVSTLSKQETGLYRQAAIPDRLMTPIMPSQKEQNRLIHEDVILKQDLSQVCPGEELIQQSSEIKGELSLDHTMYNVLNFKPENQYSHSCRCFNLVLISLASFH